MLVLVTGASGFLGAHVVHALLRQDHQVRALVRRGSPRNHIRKLEVRFVEGDLLEERVLDEACEDVDAVVHCAALVSYWSRQDDLMQRTNVDGVSALLRAMHRARAGRLVHVSSMASVGASRGGEVLDEGAEWNLGDAGIPYARSKREGEQRVRAAAWGGMDAVVVNPSVMFGPRLDGLPPSPLITGIMRGRLPWIPPGGTSVTDVEDVAEAIVRALRAGRPGERYLLAGHNLTWEQLYHAIAETAGGRVPEKKLTMRRLRWLTWRARWRDRLHLARPPWTPELFRSYGTYSWFRSTKAERELGYVIRPLPAILRHALRKET